MCWIHVAFTDAEAKYTIPNSCTFKIHRCGKLRALLWLLCIYPPLCRTKNEQSHFRTVKHKRWREQEKWQQHERNTYVAFITDLTTYLSTRHSMMQTCLFAAVVSQEFSWRRVTGAEGKRSKAVSLKHRSDWPPKVAGASPNRLYSKSLDAQ